MVIVKKILVYYTHTEIMEVPDDMTDLEICKMIGRTELGQLCDDYTYEDYVDYLKDVSL